MAQTNGKQRPAGKQKQRRKTARRPGRPIAEKSADGLRDALQSYDLEWRYNLRAQRAELRAKAGRWREVTDLEVANIRERIESDFDQTPGKPLVFGREAWEDRFNAVLYHAQIDPFLSWLESLPSWDGTQRLDGWIDEVFDAAFNDRGLVKWCSRFLLLGAVWRTYHPGTKLDEMPVLIGPQGSGKSTALRFLLPPEHPEWFSDGLRLAADDKVRAEALQGRVLVEAGEMSGVNRAERESLKAFLSRTDDGSVRLAYRRNPQTMLRRCVIAGSTNDPHCLPNDPSGNRRFVCLTVRAGTTGVTGVRRYLETHREQMWAEALEEYRRGREAYLPDDLAAAQAAANYGAVSVDESLEDAVLDILGERLQHNAGEPFTIKDIKPELRRRLGSDPSDRAVAQVLQRLDCWTRGSCWANGKKARWWFPPAPF